MNKIGPPPNQEIDITTGGTTIGVSNVNPDAAETGLPSAAFGQLIKLEITRKVNRIQQQPLAVFAVKIPYNTEMLTITKYETEVNSGVFNARWISGSTRLAEDTSDTTSKWPSGLVTPSSSTTNPRAQYQTTANGGWSNVEMTDFVKVAVQTQTPG